MSEITFNQDYQNNDLKILIASFDEVINYGITGGIITRNTFSKLKAVVEREENKDKQFISFDNVEEKVLLIRIKNDLTDVEIQKIGGKLYSRIKSLNNASLFIRKPVKTNYNIDKLINNIALGLKMQSYSFDKYFTTKTNDEFEKLETLNFIAKEEIDRNIYHDTAILANAISYARDLTNEPGNELTPEIYAKDIKRLEALGLKITLLDEKQLKAKGFNLLMSVAQGSANKPYVAILEHIGDKSKDGFDIGLVGKGVTFDSGGISIKPSANMGDMKQDMAGSAAVVASLKAAAGQNLKLNIVGIVGLVENMPSSTATRPGDVIKSLNGKTVEVINTDAEGRLVLADCLTYVQQIYKPERLVDVATLTGAIIVSLGTQMAGIFSNDDCLAELISISGEQSGEEVWRLPMNDGYRKMVKSDIADILNSTKKREAGSITAACFLEHFVENNTPWTHIDIAGMDMFGGPRALYPGGASGFGVKLLNQLCRNLVKK